MKVFVLELTVHGYCVTEPGGPNVTVKRALSSLIQTHKHIHRYIIRTHTPEELALHFECLCVRGINGRDIAELARL